MSDLKDQKLFTQLVAMYIRALYTRGYEVTFGDAYRDPRCPYGSARTMHRRRLALDLNLFKDGEYIRDVEGWREAGELWETMHERAEWGGRWSNGDANHIQLTPAGEV